MPPALPVVGDFEVCLFAPPAETLLINLTPDFSKTETPDFDAGGSAAAACTTTGTGGRVGTIGASAEHLQTPTGSSRW